MLYSEKCLAEIPGFVANILISSLLKLKLDQWQQISVDLACFSQLGANMTEIVTPFSLIANDELTLSISDSSLVPHMAEQSTFRCQ